MANKLIIWDFDGVLAPTADSWAAHGYPLTDGVRDILALPNLRHCIATNGTLEQTLEKIALCGLGDIFSASNVFTIDMAGSGKGSPTVFVLAIRMMNVAPDDTVVIDDSYTAMKGALKAGCLPISFLNRHHFDDPVWCNRLHTIGVEHIFNRMSDVKKLLTKLSA